MMLEALADPEHEEHEEMREWVGDFEPERFAPEQVWFPDARRRLRDWAK